MDLLVTLAKAAVVAAVLWFAWSALRSNRGRTGGRVDTAGQADFFPPNSFATPLRVAGVHHHREALHRLFSRHIAARHTESQSDGDFQLEEAAAELVPVSTNAHDPNAVEVRIAGLLVGFIPAKLAPNVRRLATQRRMVGPSFRCLAEVTVPLSEADDDDGWQIVLDLPTLHDK